MIDNAALAAYIQAIRHHRHFHQQEMNGVPPGSIRMCTDRRCIKAVQAVKSSRCPDSGACHHFCRTSALCFRVQCCGPLSGVFPGDRWPEEVRLSGGLEPDPGIRAAAVRHEASIIAQELDNALTGHGSTRVDQELSDQGPGLIDLLERALIVLRAVGQS